MQRTYRCDFAVEVADGQPRHPDRRAPEILRGGEAEVQRLAHVPRHFIAEQFVLLDRQGRVGGAEIQKLARLRGSEVQLRDVDNVHVFERWQFLRVTGVLSSTHTNCGKSQK